jgi:hypothetical protein
MGGWQLDANFSPVNTLSYQCIGADRIMTNERTTFCTCHHFLITMHEVPTLFSGKNIPIRTYRHGRLNSTQLIHSLTQDYATPPLFSQ